MWSPIAFSCVTASSAVTSRRGGAAAQRGNVPIYAAHAGSLSGRVGRAASGCVTVDPAAYFCSAQSLSPAGNAALLSLFNLDVLNRPPQSKPEDRGNAFESRVARSSARSAASAETEAPPLGGSQCGRREPMGVTTWETSFVVYTELRLDAYESNATRGVIKMITHAATGCSKWDSASL